MLDFSTGLPWERYETQIAGRIFGAEGFLPTGDFLTPPVKEYLGRLCKVEWERIVAAYRQSAKRVEKNDKQLERRWAGE